MTRKHSPNSARKRIFDGAAEAKLIALACSPPPKGRKRWTLALLETTGVELNIVDRASDNTIGRTLKNGLGRRFRLWYRNCWCYDRPRREAAEKFFGGWNPGKKHGPWAVADLTVVTPYGDPVYEI